MKNSFFILLLLFVFSIKVFSQEDNIEVNKGVIDLRNYNFSENGSLKLNGEWEFYWNQLLTTEELQDSIADKFCYVHEPVYWNDFDFYGEKILSYGYATFHIKVLVNSSKYSTLALDIREIMTSYECWVNGELLCKNGTVSKTKENSVPYFCPIIQPLTINNDTIDLVFKVSNYNHVFGGFFSIPKIGEITKITSARERGIAYDLFLFGAILIISIYHFGLFFLRRKNVSAFYFGLLTLFMSFRTIVTGNEFFTILFENISWYISYRIEYVTFFLGPPAFLAFLYYNFKNEVSKWILIGLTTLSILFSLTLFLPASFFSHLATPFQIVVVLLVLYTAFVMVKALIKKRDGAILLAITLGLFFITVINDVFYAQGFETVELLPMGIFVFILGQSFLLAIRFTKAFTKNEELTETLDYQNKNLENIVKERTSEIEFKKNEIVEKNEELLQQNEEILTQRDEIEKINFELQKLSIVASKTDNAIIICDKKGYFQWINEGFTRLYGYDLQQLISKFGDNIINSSKNTDIKTLIEICIKEKKSVIYESTTETVSGEIVWVQTTITPIIDSDNEVSNLIAIDSDIRKLKEAELQITAQKEILEFQHGQIKSSINYASTIQKAILPTKENLNNKFDNFIIFKPKDVVSGDFYWFSEIKKYTFLAVVDCTGHGVPGAFMSMIGSRLINEIVNERQILEPNKILECLDFEIKRSLHQHESANADGMDVCLCRFEKLDANNCQLIYSGAKRSLIYYKKDEKLIASLKGTRRSIGGLSSSRNNLQFEALNLNLKKDDIVYLSTDGFVDQNNVSRKRMGSSHLLMVLEEIINLQMNEQKLILEEMLIKWMEGTEQRDDITMIGLKIISI